MPRIITFTCANPACGKVDTTSSHNKRYCSRACRDAGYQREHTCEICGAVFIGVPTAKVCDNPECRHTAKRTRENAWNQAHRFGHGGDHAATPAERERQACDRVVRAVWLKADAFERRVIEARNSHIEFVEAV